VAEPPQASRDFYGALQRFQLALVGIGRRLWRQVLPGDLDGSWARVAPQMVAYTAGAQLAAARTAADYVPAVLAETGQRDDPDARVRPEAFAGTAYDGRPLDTLLEGGIRHRQSQDRHRRGPGRSTRRRPAMAGDRAPHRRHRRRPRRHRRPDRRTRRRRLGTAGQPALLLPLRRPRRQMVRLEPGVPPPPALRLRAHPRRENMAGSFVTDPHELWRRGLITDLSLAQEKRLEQDADLVKVLNESRDRWRVRMALQRKAEKEAAKRRGAWGTNEPTPLPPGGIQDFLSHLTSRVEALRELEARGITE
jgi:hypothetical protein